MPHSQIYRSSLQISGQPVQKVIGISNVYDAYEFKFTKEKADEVHKWCTDRKTIKKNPTQYIVQREGGMKISVDNFKSWRDGDFETLYQFGTMNGGGKESQKSRTQQPQKTNKRNQQLDEAKASYAARFPNIDFDKRRNEVEKYNEEEKVEQGTVTTTSTASQQK